MGVFSDIFSKLFSWLLPEQPKAETGLDVTKADTNAYIPVAYGRCYGGGLLVYQATNDMDNDDIKNDLLHQVVVWSEGECGGVINNYVDDELSTSSRFNASGGLKWFYARNLTDGLFGYSDPTLAASGRRPTDSFRGKLVSYLRSEMTDGEVWNGQPNHKAEYNGRLISTPSGGALTASENPVDQLYDLLKSPIYGKGLTTAHIDVASFQAARPICETLVETYAGSGEYRKLFTSNISLDTSNSVLENVNTLLKAMRGWLFHSDGKLKLLIEKDDAPVDFNIDENDQGFIEFGDVSNSSKANRYNRVICRYTDPDSGWTKQEVVYPAAGSQEETDLLAEDNGVVLEKSISLDTCIYYHEAAHHAKTILEVSREQLRTSVTWGPEAVILEVGDIVPVTRSALGWNGKLFRIESTEKSTQDGTVQLKLREHQPYIYDDANMGDKPVLPDTSITYDAPSAPSAPVFTDVYNDFAQVKLDWTSSTSDHRIVIKDSLGNQVLNSTFAGKSFSFENFAVDTYTVKIYAIGGLGRQSTPLETSVTIIAQVTPTASPTVTSKPGFITVAPPLPTATKYTYEWRWSTSQDATLITGGKDIAKTIADVIPDVTYTIEYRLITPYSEGAWESVDVNGVEKLTYIWYVYADDNIGTGISTDPTGKAYFGIVGGKASPTVDITDPTIFDYYIQPDGGASAGAGITAQVTKENILINTASDGSGGDFTGANSTFSVLAGSTDDTNNWTVQATDSASVTGSLSGHTYTVTALSADTGTITFTATRTDYPTLTKVVTVIKVKDGATGPQGVQGETGPNGQPTYTWIRYADSATGTNSSNDPTGKEYIGFAYNKTTPIESTDPNLYTWSLIKGEPGVDGPAGPNGDPTYTWIKYADNATGTVGFGDSSTGKTHIGIATNKTTATESADPTDYTWSLFKGDQGIQGDQGVAGDDAIYAKITYTNGSAFVRHSDGTLTPSQNYTDVACTFYEGSTALGTETIRATVEADNRIGYSLLSGTADITNTRSDKDTTRAFTFEHTPSGVTTVAVIIVTSAFAGAGWFTSQAEASANGRQLVVNDIAINNGTPTKWNGTSWVTVSAFIDGDMVVNGTLGAGHLTVSSLSALAATMGTVTGGTFQTALSGARTVVSGVGTKPIKVLDSSGNESFSVNTSGQGFFSGGFAASTIDNLNYFSQDIIDQFTYAPSGSTQTGGSSSVSNQSHTTATKTYTLPSSIVASGSGTTTFEVRFSDFGMDFTGPTSYTAPQYTVTINRNTSGTAIYSQTFTGYADEAYYNVNDNSWEPGEWGIDIDIAPTAVIPAGTHTYSVTITRTQGEVNDPKLGIFSASEPVVTSGGGGGGGTTYYAGTDLYLTGGNTFNVNSSTASTANTVTKRDGSGDITAKGLWLEDTATETHLDLNKGSTTCRFFIRSSNNQFGIYINGDTKQRFVGSTNRWSFEAGVDCDNTITCTSLTETSSIRRKQIVNRDYDTLAKVCALGEQGAVSFVTNGSNDIRVGFIAEEAFLHFPSSVSYNESGQIDSLHYTGMIAPLYVAVKQLNDKIADQQTTINDLLQRIEALENA